MELIRIESGYLETEDIVLKSGNINDFNDLYNNYWRHEITAKYMLWPVVRSLEEAYERMQRTIEYQKNKTSFCVYLKPAMIPIGLAGVKITEEGILEDSGVGIGPDFVRKGYGRQITKALTAFSFLILKAKIVKFSCCEDNKASAKMIENCGFTYMGLSEEMTRKYDGKKYRARMYEISYPNWYENNR